MLQAALEKSGRKRSALRSLEAMAEFNRVAHREEGASEDELIDA